MENYAKKTDTNNIDKVNSENSPKKTTRYNHKIFRDWCKSCGICSAFCPGSVIEMDEKGRPVIKNPDKCIGCRLCELRCPDFAISIQERENDQKGNS